MAFGAISRAAKGFYGLIDLVTDGIGPRDANQVVQPTMDMLPFYAADTWKLRDATQAAVPFAEFTTVPTADQFGPAVGLSWLVHHVSAWLTFIPPFRANLTMGILGLPYAINRSSGIPDTGPGVIYLNPSGPQYFTQAGVGPPWIESAVAVITYQFKTPFVMVGGGPVSLFALATGVDTTGSPGLGNYSVTIAALVNEVPS